MRGQSETRWDENRNEFRENVPDYSEFAYDQITPELVDWIVDDATARALELAQQITESDELTYDTTMGRLAKIGSLQEHAYGKACFMNAVHPDKAVRDTAEEAMIRMFREVSKIFFDPKFYEKIAAYQETEEGWNLGGERGGALTGTVRYLEQIGHGLPEKQQKIVFEKYRQIIENEIAFQRNIDKDDTVVPFTADDLSGMPQSYLDSLKRDENGNYEVTMQYPHIHPLLALADNREVRARAKQAFDSRAKKKNRDLLIETLDLRWDIARKLGYRAGWAQYILDDETDTMIKSPDHVESFLIKLINNLEGAEAREIKKMTELLHADGHEGELKSYDFSYYENKARKEMYPFDDAEVAKYFPTEAVLDGMFNLHREVFGIEYRIVDKEPVWNDDVLAVAVDDVESGRELGLIYFDLYPRDGKYSHAATFPLRYGYILPDETRQLPAAAVVCNFPTSGLLSQRNINYLLHETGHAIHQVLAQTEELSHSGFNIEWDFVEMMSQVQEYWGHDPEILKRFSRHSETGEQIPDGLARLVTDSEKSFNVADAMRRVAMSYYDQIIHTGQPLGDFDEYMREAQKISPFIEDEGSCFPATFGHIMGGYDAMFYGYAWSRTYALQVFERFQQEGLTNQQVGREFRENFLEPGGTLKAHEMLKGFFKKHKRQSIQPYLRSLGIKK